MAVGSRNKFYEDKSLLIVLVDRASGSVDDERDDIDGKHD